MSRVASDLERVVRRHPTQWFNFYRFWQEPVTESGPHRSPSGQPEEASARV
jgi:predicted LPLAT superfamily acyltransferase